MKTEDIKAFVAVVQKQSISHAAEVLHITQPAITRRIQNLESALGIDLLDRNTKPPKPTPMGRRVFDQCQAVLRELKALKTLAASNTAPAGDLRLGITQVIGDYVLIDALKDLSESFPDVQAKLSTHWSARLITQVASGDLDAATVLMPAGFAFPEHVSVDNLLALEMVPVGRRCDFAERPYTLRDLHQHGWILNPEGCGFRNKLQRALAAQGLPLQVNLDTFGTELQLGLVASGVGIGLTPHSLLSASRHRDSLMALDVTDFKLEVNLWLVHLEELGNLLQPVRQFGASIAAGFSAGLPATVQP
ncbi:HTH-type transcriptional regulator YofA [Andreprevotia sp. IGB-42]|uniref:LysR family transcriptional regulator n=1 Tax=Andreprevotia sp. IGB-42 TaxID=2497473 RepID=UPI00135AA2F5|nr:LysR family transcriptional regulator [Andreprevotia sp. IGB-42]KAF0812637.1 HTH-type transcriptional regulator YofA [Andreprevotia sp. IGB-42]